MKRGYEARIRVEQRYADMTYPLKEASSPVQLSNIVKGGYIHIDAEDYLKVHDVLYPAFPIQDPDDFSVGCALMVLTNAMFTTPIEPSHWELYLLPLLVQQNEVGQSRYQLNLTASISRQSYKVTVSVKSTIIFASLALFIVVFCTTLLSYAGFKPIPERSAFPEFDLAAKMGSNVDREGDSSVLQKISLRMIKLERQNAITKLSDFTVMTKVGSATNENNALCEDGYQLDSYAEE
jgi:hypothetical protein